MIRHQVVFEVVLTGFKPAICYKKPALEEIQIETGRDSIETYIFERKSVGMWKESRSVCTTDPGTLLYPRNMLR
jgi:hypothetical protein